MTYDTLDQAYKHLVPSLVSYASKHLYSKSMAIDAVHDSFVKAQIYLNKNPKAKISGFLLQRETARACRRLNKFSREISVDFNSVFKSETQAE